MRKWLVVLFLGVFALSSLTVSASTQEIFKELASFFPETTQQFFAIRTDADQLTAVQDLLNRFDKRFPNQGIKRALDMLSQSITGESFAKGVGSWLGDGIAIGTSQTLDTLQAQAMMNGRISLQPYTIVVNITDRAKAKAFVDAVIENNFSFSDLTETEEGDYTVWTGEFGGTKIALGDSMLFIGLFNEDLPLEGVEKPLSENADFNDTVALLPADEYAVVVYQNTASLFEIQRATIALSLQMFRTDNPNLDIPPTPEWLTTLLRSQAIGLTFINGSFVVDVAQTVSPDVVETFGISMEGLNAIDTAMTATIPSNVLAFVQGAGTNSPYSLSDYVNRLDELIAESGGLLSVLGISPEVATDAFIDPQAQEAIKTFLTPGTFLAAINVTFSGLTGMSLERDVLSVMNGDGVAYIRLLKAPRDVAMQLPLLPDVVVMQASNDAEGLQNIFNNLVASTEAYDTKYPVDNIDGRDVLVMNLFSQLSQKSGGKATPFADVLFTTTDNLFMVGTRAGINDQLNGAMELNITETPEYKRASALFLPDAQQIAFLSPRNLVEPIEEYFRSIDQKLPQDALALRDAVLLIDSAALSTHSTAEFTLVRATLTLSEPKQ